MRMKDVGDASRRMLDTLLCTLLDTIAPPRERTARMRKRSLADIPLDPRPITLHDRTVLTLLHYSEPAVADLIRSLKYENGSHAASLAAQLLADFLLEEIASIRAWSARPIILVPVPLHPTRQRERTFNQITRVLALLPAELRDGSSALLAPDLLVRTRHTPAQAKLSRAERLENVADAFALAPEAAPSESHVILIDDVATTGATLAAASAPLLEIGATITLLALARA